MKKFLVALAALAVLSSVAVHGQATTQKKLAWDQPASSLAEAQAYSYKYYPDNAPTGIALNPVICVGTVSPYQCEVLYPAFTPGAHTLTITASNEAGESPKSAPLSFTFVVIPGIPQNLRIK